MKLGRSDMGRSDRLMLGHQCDQKLLLPGDGACLRFRVVKMEDEYRAQIHAWAAEPLDLRFLKLGCNRISYSSQ